MKIQSNITMNGRSYSKGDEIPGYKVYPFFMVHMLVFGCSGFYMAYADKGAPVLFLYAHGGFACLIYTMFYLAIFGRDEVKWMFINAAMGLFGIYTQMGWLLSFFGRRIEDYPFYVHVIPFLYFVLYTFLFRHAVLDLTNAREDAHKKKWVEYAYIVVSTMIYLFAYFLEGPSRHADRPITHLQKG